MLVKLTSSQQYSPLERCSTYGHPLDLLTQAPEASRWRLAEILLQENTIRILLNDHSPLWRLDLDTYSAEAFKKRLNVYTHSPRTLQQCIMHVLTKSIIGGLSVIPGLAHDRLLEALSARRMLQLPNLNVCINNDGLLRMVE